MLGAVAATMILSGRWSTAEANDWGARQRWSAGCNFIPSTAINQLEMWQAQTFDPTTIDREFGLMQRTGLSLARIFLHDLAYEADPSGFKKRMQAVLNLAKKHEVRIVFVFFDDCWNPLPKIGIQPVPRPGVHNSGWVQSPSVDQRSWPGDFPRLKAYVGDVLRTFKTNRSVFMWDLYNEPGNSGHDQNSLPLLREAFGWAHEVRPSQPLTAGAYSGGTVGLDRSCLDLSDVTSFHCYGDAEDLKKQIAFYKSFGRPVVCTEWMARPQKSLIRTHLPIFQAENVSCLQWGFVSGKTNTIFPWGSKEGSPEPKIWFHDLYRADGTPFDPGEVARYRSLCLPTKSSK
jgi:hypothetical protein